MKKTLTQKAVDGTETIYTMTTKTSSKVSPSVTIPEGDTVNDLKLEAQQGHSFLGCFCDMRRAVLAVDATGSLLYVAAAIVTIVWKNVDINKDIVLLSDDAVGTPLFFIFANVFFHMIGFAGALCFKASAVFLAITWQSTYAAINASLGHWVPVAIYTFILYPHVVLCYELGRGVLSEQNYSEQGQKSCCCV